MSKLIKDVMINFPQLETSLIENRIVKSWCDQVYCPPAASDGTSTGLLLGVLLGLLLGLLLGRLVMFRSFLLTLTTDVNRC